MAICFAKKGQRKNIIPAGYGQTPAAGILKPGETAKSKAAIRLKQEMGITCALNFGFKFRYQTPVGNGLVENELDYVYFGIFSGQPAINLKEAERLAVYFP